MESGLLLAAVAMERGEKDVARAFYNDILENNPECRQALNGLAKLSFQNSDYVVSHAAFKRLVELFPDNLSYQINNAMSGVLAGKATELLNEVYRLDFENENNGTVKRLLAGLCSVSDDLNRLNPYMKKFSVIPLTILRRTILSV